MCNSRNAVKVILFIIRGKTRDKENTLGCVVKHTVNLVVVTQETGDLVIGLWYYRDGRDSRFADAGDITERVAFSRYN